MLLLLVEAVEAQGTAVVAVLAGSELAQIYLFHLGKFIQLLLGLVAPELQILRLALTGHPVQILYLVLLLQMVVVLVVELSEI
jgi:hypothetical protein